MKLDLSEIAANLGLQIQYDIDEPAVLDEPGGLRCLEPITGEVTFANTGRSIVARGRFRTAVELECSRCLQAFKFDVEESIEESLPLKVSAEALESGEQIIEERDEELEHLFVENVFDLEEYLRQSILVALPIKPLCSEQCKGLCRACGKNLNEGPCDCPTEQAASPFAPLASLLEQQDKETREEQS